MHHRPLARRLLHVAIVIDAIELLRIQHEELAAQLCRVAALESDARRPAFEKVADVLEAHLLIEERHLARAAEDAAPLRSAMHELLALEARDARFLPLLAALEDQLRAHVRSDEGGVFERIARELTDTARWALGQAMLATLRCLPKMR